MLGTLLESRAPRQRGGAGATFSIAAHVAILAMSTAATLEHPAVHRDRTEPVVLHFAPEPPPVQPRTVMRSFSLPDLRSTVSLTVLRLPVPTLVPTAIPAIDDTRRPSPNDQSLGQAAPRDAFGPRSVVDAGDHASPSVWRASELLTRIVTAAKPRYPDLLRRAGIDGQVLVRFTVDTAGRVDMTSVVVLASTHDLFTRAVLAALPNFRFAPAEIDGRRVGSLAEMPFEFRIAP
jgi:protein TonB